MLTALLIGLPGSLVAQETDFAKVPSGSIVVLPEGDTLVVRVGSRLVSDSAIVRMDLALRTARHERDSAREDAEDYKEISEIRTRQKDSLSVALNLTERLISSQPAPWLETFENFGLAVGGFAVCRALDNRNQLP